MCKFTGLVAFPYDTLGCSIEFGGWAAGGGWQGITSFPKGFVDLTTAEATSGSSYQVGPERIPSRKLPGSDKVGPKRIPSRKLPVSYQVGPERVPSRKLPVSYQ